jgi:hypothetical protein
MSQRVPGALTDNAATNAVTNNTLPNSVANTMSHARLTGRDQS